MNVLSVFWRRISCLKLSLENITLSYAELCLHLLFCGCWQQPVCIMLWELLKAVWKPPFFINVNCDRRHTKCGLGNSPTGWIGIFALVFIIPQDHLLPCEKRFPGLPAGLAWPDGSFYLHASTSCGSWINLKQGDFCHATNRRHENCLQAEFCILCQCSRTENRVTPVHRNSPAEFWAPMLSLPVLSASGENWT